MRRPWLTIPCAALLPMICANCGPSGDAKPGVAIPTNCARFEHTVSDPIDDEARKVGENAKAILATYRVKLGIANKRIIDARDCNADIRARFSGAVK